jgi:ABC-type nickel/cobalt efflux system permease component RcnA
MSDKMNPMQRRLRFSLLILVSQVLLISLAIAWLVHMITIAMAGSAYFVEDNPLILWLEISISVLIILFAFCLLLVQIQRLGERRGDDRKRRRE